MAKKRLGIFLFFDLEGIADRFIEYMLRDIRPCLDHLIVISNGEMGEEASKMFGEIADEVVIRENRGFDVGAWQEGIVSVCGREKLKEYDSLTLFNDSFFGPFYPFSEIYAEMESRNKDYWGLSVHGAIDGTGDCPYGYRPRYIQTYFMVFEKRLLHSKEFFSFWEKLPEYTKFIDLAEKFVGVLTMHFSDLGYEWDVLCDTTDLEGERSANYDQHTFNIYELIANRRYPIIKRRSFHAPKSNYLLYANGREFPAAFEYVKKNYDYDLSMIFEHLFRLYDPEDIKSSLCLDFVFGDSSGSDPLKKGEGVVIADLRHEDMFERHAAYFDNIPEEMDIVVTTGTESSAKALGALLGSKYGQRLSIRTVTECPHRIAALLVGCRDILTKYKYLCFLYDSKSPDDTFATVGSEFDRLNWDNCLHSKGYVRNIIGKFKEQSFIGMLAPFAANHGSYFTSSVNCWDTNYDMTVALAERLGIKPPAFDKHSLAANGCFWCRTKAMKPIFENDFTYDEFNAPPDENAGEFHHACRLLLSYAAAKSRYATGWIYTADYAMTELSSLRYMLDSTAANLSTSRTIRTDSFKAFLATAGKLKKVNAEAKRFMKRKALKEKRRRNIRQRIKSVTPPFVLKIYRNIRYR